MRLHHRISRRVKASVNRMPKVSSRKVAVCLGSDWPIQRGGFFRMPCVAPVISEVGANSLAANVSRHHQGWIAPALKCARACLRSLRQAHIYRRSDIEKTGVGCGHPQDRTVSIACGCSIARRTGENRRVDQANMIRSTRIFWKGLW
jgi:hypothetical protein